MENYKTLIVCIIMIAIVATFGFVNMSNFINLAPDNVTQKLMKLDDTLTLNSFAQGKTSSRDTTQLLARAVNGEARGEPYIGQVAVGAVICNRTRHPSFPKSISGVIYQPGAFTAVSDGQINVPIANTSAVLKAAKDALNGWDPSDGAIYYYNPAKTTNKWIWSRQVIKTIGKHKFAK